MNNRFLTFLSNLFTNLNVTDIESGYKTFCAEVLRIIDLKEKRFGFEPEMTAKICPMPGIGIYEAGISYYGSTYNEGNNYVAVMALRPFIRLKYRMVSKNSLKLLKEVRICFCSKITQLIFTQRKSPFI